MNRDLLLSAIWAAVLHAGAVVAIGRSLDPARVFNAEEIGIQVMFMATAPRLEATGEQPVATAPLPPPPVEFEEAHLAPHPPSAVSSPEMLAGPRSVSESLPAPTPLALPDVELPDDLHVGLSLPVEQLPAAAAPADPVASATSTAEGGERARRRQPLAIRNDPPRYPRVARIRGYQGVVLLEVQVLASGRPGTVRIERSSGFKMLDRAAAGAVEDWQFKPALEAGRPIVAWVQIPVEFRLEE